MSEKLRWGVLGSARIVRKTIPALQETKNGEVIGIASRTEEKAREYAGRLAPNREAESAEVDHFPELP